VISTVNGDANTYFYKELAAQKVDPAVIPVMAFSIGERELSAWTPAPSSETWRPGITSSRSTQQKTKLS
jgi:hypothetical protein